MVYAQWSISRNTEVDREEQQPAGACLCRDGETAAASQLAAEVQQLRQALAQMRHENAELRAALQEACLATMPPEAAQYVHVRRMTDCLGIICGAIK